MLAASGACKATDVLASSHDREKVAGRSISVSRSRSSTMAKPLARMCALFTSLVFGVSCSDYPHANPWDPDADIEVELNGPGTTYSVGEVVTFTYRTVPEWPGVVAFWSSSNDLSFQSVGNGVFRVFRSPSGSLPQDPVTVTVRLGPHVQTQTVALTQRPAILRFIGCATGPSCVRFASLGIRLTLELELEDALGEPVEARFIVQYPATFVSRRPDVVRVSASGARSVIIESVAPGSSYLVAATGTAMDSVLVTVQ